MILLTQNRSLPGPSAVKASKLGVPVYALGGAAAAASASLKATPVVGADRVATSVKAAEMFVPQATTAVLASGGGFADALSGGALAANKGGLLLLTRPESVTPALAAHRRRSSYTEVLVSGGKRSVFDATMRRVAELLRR
ncbi:MAG: cell wall-binding repeat-containing protein [Buchananella hordeovulneris]|nr:cell wall-binding repeat-containing protein [Buchananella hordeovulneris]